MNDERNYIEIVNADGSVDKVELIGTINSKRDDKVYAVLTEDEVIGEEVNVSFGYLYEEEGEPFIEYLKDKEEIAYVKSLMSEFE